MQSYHCRAFACTPVNSPYIYTMERIQIDARPGIAVLDEFRRQLSPKEIDLALSRSINRSISQGRTIARKKVAEIYNIPQRKLMQVVDISRATSAKLIGKVLADSAPLPLKDFDPKFDTPTKSIRVRRRTGAVVTRNRRRARRGNAKGTLVKVKKAYEAVEFAFMTPSRPNVFARGSYSATGFQQRFTRKATSGNDLPIQGLLSVSVHTAVINPEVMEAMAAKVAEVYPAELRRELQQRVNRIARNVPQPGQ